MDLKLGLAEMRSALNGLSGIMAFGGGQSCEVDPDDIGAIFSVLAGRARELESVAAKERDVGRKDEPLHKSINLNSQMK